MLIMFRIQTKSLPKTVFPLIVFAAVLFMIIGRENLRGFYEVSVREKLTLALNYFGRCQQDCNTESRDLFDNSCANCIISSKVKAESHPLINKYADPESQNVSYCSDAASQRGPHQQIVSFSFYGSVKSSRHYFEGIEENAKLIEKFYPNWIMRVYHNITPIELNTATSYSVFKVPNDLANSTTNGTKCESLGITDDVSVNIIQGKIRYLQCKYRNLDFCFVDVIPGFGKLSEHHPMTWRFLPMADALVDVFVSRDLDSRISEREVIAVEEWLHSNLTFHMMRDHPDHGQPVLGGMWGAVVNNQRDKLADVTKQVINGGIKHYAIGKDQYLLRDILWPVTIGKLMQHDSYHCSKFSGHGNMQPWPTQRQNTSYNFVGARYRVDVNPMQQICPSSCRPKDKQDWLTC